MRILNSSETKYSSCFAASSLRSLNFLAFIDSSAGRTIISVPPTDQRVIKGTTAILDCNATHDPRVDIRCLLVTFSIFYGFNCPYRHCLDYTYASLCSFKWKRGGVPVLSTSGGRVSVRKGSLTIGQTWSGDIGDYTCTVTSQAGNDSGSARLEVM